MELEFWEQRWQENQIGFHLPDVNPYLITHWNELNLSPGEQVFVPLCGKSLDLIWLAKQSLNVIGIECSQLAVESFFNENNIPFEVTKDHSFNHYQSENIRILQGDYFDLKAKDLASISAVYDRASLVAMPSEMRTKYAKKLISILPEQVRILLVSLEYDQSVMTGPPFSVTESEVKQLYDAEFDIQIAQRSDIIDEQTRFKDRGLDYLIETVYLLEKK